MAGTAEKERGLEEILRIAEAVKAGSLKQRGNVNGLSGDWAEAVSAVNGILDAVAVPLDIFTSHVRRLAVGAIPDRIDNKWSGEFCLIADALNASSRALTQLMDELNHMSEEHDKGDIDVTIATNKFQNDFGKVANGINTMVAGHIAVKKKAMACVAEFGKGNFDAPLDKFPGKKAFINDTIEGVRANLKGLMVEVDAIIGASIEGRLDFRANASRHQGDFGKIVQGINDALDAILFPISEGNRVLAMIRGGNLREKVEITCKGDQAKMKDAVNGVHSWLEALVTYAKGIANGDLTVKMAKASQDDQIHEWLMLLKGNIGALVADANMLAQAAVDGRLATRADAAKHQGDYRKIVEGVNATLDSVIGPMNNIAQGIDALGKNDMTTVLKGEYRGDFLAVKEAFDNAMTGINSTLFQIVDAVEQVGQSAEQLNSASQNMAATSMEQSSSVEEVTSSLTETNSQVKANTENANIANQLVMGTSQAASEGQAKMAEMTSAMNAINASAQNIAKIIKVIDEIAFQTNLLALNAAVEAARAGQHGRGFAVVAQEVRNLAGRSAKAARETAEMIEDSVKRVGEGVNIAKETSEALNQIVTNVLKVKDLVAEIATASTEQARGITQISVAMNQVSKAAQDGTQQSEELASASSELNSVAGRMREEVRRFKLRERSAQSLSRIEGLEGLTPEMLAQIRAMLNSGEAARIKARADVAKAGDMNAAKRKLGKTVIPLDSDERGFGKF